MYRRALIWGVFWAFSTYWTIVIIRRIPNDIKDYKKSQEIADKGVIIFYWVTGLLTAFFSLAILRTVILTISSAFD